MQKKKKLSIGIEFFKAFKRDNFYYADSLWLLLLVSEIHLPERK